MACLCVLKIPPYSPTSFSILLPRRKAGYWKGDLQLFLTLLGFFLNKEV